MLFLERARLFHEKTSISFNDYTETDYTGFTYLDIDLQSALTRTSACSLG